MYGIARKCRSKAMENKPEEEQSETIAPLSLDTESGEFIPVTFGEKMSYLQKLVMEQDWSDDKAYTLGGTLVPYLSADKILRQFAPLFRKAGLVFVPRFHSAMRLEPIEKRPNHWGVQIEADIVDLDSDRKLTYNAYGEGADNQDKGLVIAQTVALRKLLAAVGLLVDGIDIDGNYDDASSFKKTPQEQNEIKGKVFNKAIPKPTDVPKPKAKPAAPKAPVAEKPETEKKFVAPKVEAPALKADAPSEEGFVMTEVQRNSLNHIEALWKDKLDKGETTQGNYDKMKSTMESIRSMKDMMKFSKEFGVVF